MSTSLILSETAETSSWSFDPSQPIMPNPNCFPESECPPNFLAGNPPNFPSLNLEDNEDKANLQTALWRAVKNSVLLVKLERIASRFDQLALEAGLTRGELEVLRQTNYERGVVNDLISAKWRDCAGDNRKDLNMTKVKAVVASWKGTNGNPGGTVRTELTFRELYEWKLEAEAEVYRLNLDEVLRSPATEVDWDFVSRELDSCGYGLRNLSAKRCRGLWKNFLGPHVRPMASWTQADVDKLQDLIGKSEAPNFFEIAKKMGHGYSGVMCYKVYLKYLQPVRNLEKEEDEPSTIYRLRNSDTGKSTASTSESSSSSSEPNASMKSSAAQVQNNTSHPVVFKDRSSHGVVDFSIGNMRLAAFNHGIEVSKKELQEILREEDPLTKRGSFDEVEDAILLVTLEKLRPYFLADEEGMTNCLEVYLPWRQNFSWETRIDFLYKKFYEQWTVEEDSRLLRLTQVHRGNWKEISQHFLHPPRSRKNVLKRVRLLEKSLKTVTLSEYHEFTYNVNPNTRARTPYESLRRALDCLDSSLRGHELGEDWAMEYYKRCYRNHRIKPSPPPKPQSDFEPEQTDKEAEDKFWDELEEKLDKEERVCREQGLEYNEEQRLCELGVITQADLEEIKATFPADLWTGEDCKVYEDVQAEVEVETYNNIEAKDDKDCSDEEHRRADISAVSDWETSGEPGPESEGEAGSNSEQNSDEESDTDNSLQRITRQEKPSQVKSEGPRPPNSLDLLENLWTTHPNYIRQAIAHVSNFLKEQNVSPQLTIDEKLHRPKKRAGRVFDRTNAKSLALAAYVRKVQFKCDEELDGTHLTQFEEDVLERFKFYKWSRCLKKSTKRKIPEKHELLALPELQKLIQPKVVIKKEDPWSFLTFIPPKMYMGDIDFPEEELEPEPESILPHTASEIDTFLRRGIDEGANYYGGIQENESAAHARLCLDVNSEDPAEPVPEPERLTTSKGRGKKRSRISRLRSEVAKRRWAESRGKINLSGNIIDELKPEQ